MVPNPQILLLIATVLYGVSAVSAWFLRCRPMVAWIFLVHALMINVAAVVVRYHQAWPMLPMYLSTTAVPAFLGLMLFFVGRDTDPTFIFRKILLTLTLIITAATVLFPKDFYLPFIRSQTPTAHFFFWFTVAGKGCFLMSAVWAMVDLFGKTNLSPKTEEKHRIASPIPSSCSPMGNDRVKRWTIWGFAFWTLGMFSGELWSYLGWGTPVVWDDPAITTTMATWFFYICLLHLHLTGSWTSRRRCIFTAAGAFIILCINCVPDLGPFRGPFTPVFYR